MNLPYNDDPLQATYSSTDTAAQWSSYYATFHQPIGTSITATDTAAQLTTFDSAHTTTVFKTFSSSNCPPYQAIIRTHKSTVQTSFSPAFATPHIATQSSTLTTAYQTTYTTAFVMPYSTSHVISQLPQPTNFATIATANNATIPATTSSSYHATIPPARDEAYFTALSCPVKKTHTTTGWMSDHKTIATTHISPFDAAIISTISTTVTTTTFTSKHFSFI